MNPAEAVKQVRQLFDKVAKADDATWLATYDQAVLLLAGIEYSDCEYCNEPVPVALLEDGYCRSCHENAEERYWFGPRTEGW